MTRDQMLERAALNQSSLWSVNIDLKTAGYDEATSLEYAVYTKANAESMARHYDRRPYAD